ncbi:tRNA G18 (ribose-2'-O)-methylase SpoU [Wenyingzhuangia heitensis]|uniref:tRNA G18 (Ribose-2'-O)-methylase SpoU n=1 Tax=Wenyingzhuangia heitensis TaxID=1487859 RepID=A0ABX0UAU2_9FLAO|nr:TrmH family RNA methyltransferase [Wenyingzhuangia heitensis]NIJ45393.1 tRNA G18 (ribose-2'-O)-methylase SpoU [Wenyingzhuangia heitensis]
MEQLNHIKVKNTQKSFPIVVVGEELRTPQNVGMSMRTSEAFGVSAFYLNSNSPDTSNRLVQRTARNTDKTLTIFSYDNIISLLTKLKEEEYQIIALEITDTSKNIHDYNFTTHAKIALLIGSERFGINKEALKMCDDSVHIPMYGNNSSMNVVNSLSVSLYEITKQLNNK